MINKILASLVLSVGFITGSLAQAGQADSGQTRVHSFKLAGKAAQQIMALGSLKTIECVDHSFRNPDTDQMMDAPYCKLKGVVFDVQPVYWFPREHVGKIQVEFDGPSANELVQRGLHILGEGGTHISCSQYAWAPGTGHCTAIIEMVDEIHTQED